MSPLAMLWRDLHLLPAQMIAIYGLVLGLVLGAGYDYFKEKTKRRQQ
jgi:hypothetical protein